MRKFLMTAATTVALSGCVSTNPPQEPLEYQVHMLTSEETAHVEGDVRHYLRNPEALFAGLNAAEAPSGSVVVCGWVRRKYYDFTEYARFPANRPFAARYERGSSGRLRGFQMVHFANVKAEAPPLYTYCAQQGIPM